MVGPELENEHGPELGAQAAAQIGWSVPVLFRFWT